MSAPPKQPDPQLHAAQANSDKNRPVSANTADSADSRTGKEAQFLPILSVKVRGCTITTPMSPGETVNDAVWAALKRFNYDPRKFSGWSQTQGSKGCIAVRVS